VAPVMLNTFKMPLIHNSYDFLSFTAINVGEKTFVSFVNKDFLHFWEENINGLDVPVNEMLIKAFFSEGSWSN
jgi:hypothetical protein